MNNELIRKADAVRIVLHYEGQAAVAAMQDLQPVDFVPVKSCRMVVLPYGYRPYDDGRMYCVCTNCGYKREQYHFQELPNFCPRCGRKLYL